MLNKLSLNKFQKRFAHNLLTDVHYQMRYNNFVRLANNGLELNNFYRVTHQEARLNCRCPECWFTFNQPKNSESFEDVVIKEIISVDTEYVHLKWSDDHTGIFPRKDSSAFPGVKMNSNEMLELAMRKNSALNFWSKPDKNIYREFLFDDIKNNEIELQKCLIQLTKYGIATIKGVPQESDTVIKLPELLGLGPVWSSLFGSPFKVQNKKNKSKNHAYTGKELPLHTDIPYYSQPPGVFLFHCISNKCEGGESFYVDSFACINEFRKRYPEEFKILTTVEVTFRDLQDDWHLVSTHPIIELNPNGIDIFRINDSPAARDFYDWIPTEFETRENWYKSYNLYRKFIEDPSRRFEFKMKPGDLTIFDNWRVYHARNKFIGDERHMEGCYMEWSHVRSKLLKLTS